MKYALRTHPFSGRLPPTTRRHASDLAQAETVQRLARRGDAAETRKRLRQASRVGI